MHKIHKKPDESDNRNPRYLTPVDYLNDRVEDQLNWYSRRSADNKRWYYRLQLITLLSAVSVPVLALSSGDIRVRFLVAIMGAVAALSAGIISLYQLRDQWLDYRATAESIKLEKYLFLTRTEPYETDKAFTLFVKRIEAIIISENQSWRNKSFNLPEADSDDSDERDADERDADDAYADNAYTDRPDVDEKASSKEVEPV